MNNLIPCSTEGDENPVVDVEMQMFSIWDKTEVYLKIISVPLIIVAVTVVGFLTRFFKEIIIPTVLALFLFQVSKPIVLRLHKHIIPYYWYVEEEIPDEESLLIGGEKVDDNNLLFIIQKTKKVFKLCWGKPPRFLCSFITVLLLLLVIFLFIYPIALSVLHCIDDHIQVQDFLKKDYRIYVDRALEVLVVLIIHHRLSITQVRG